MAELGAGLADVIARKIAATVMLVQDVAGHAEASMKQHAPWRDRTGNARNGLSAFVKVERSDEVTRIVLDLGHSVEYGVFLEQAHAGKYAIVGPTADQVGPDLQQRVRELWSMP